MDSAMEARTAMLTNYILLNGGRSVLVQAKT